MTENLDSKPDVAAVTEYMLQLQDTICQKLEAVDGRASFTHDPAKSPSGGLANPRVLEDGRHLEKAAVHFTHSIGAHLPAAASERRPELAGKAFQAVAFSMILHPRNPYVPTMHANLRFFVIDEDYWYFGGGMDLTPYYGFVEDAVHWHREIRSGCAAFRRGLYQQLKERCDEYFYLPHREEHRGIGGAFFDDWREGGFATSFALAKAIGDRIQPAYLPIFESRKDTRYEQRQRDFQLYRRGRYVEFNLLLDRGTRYGIESGRNTESILASLPPAVSWRYRWQPLPDSEEEKLTAFYLIPRDWANY